VVDAHRDDGVNLVAPPENQGRLAVDLGRQ
jgi:hypothetical protein